MHPDLLSPLAKERHESLLRQREFRERAKRATNTAKGQPGQSFRLRLAAGHLLVSVGTRLSQPRDTGFDLVRD